MRSLSIAAVALLGSALSAASAEQTKATHSGTQGQAAAQATHVAPAIPARIKQGNSQELLGTVNPNPTMVKPKVVTQNGASHHSNVSGGNDLCGSATNISGTGPFNGDNIGAGTDGPAFCAALGSDVWYNWTAGFTGPAIFSLCGSTYDTAITIYDTAACQGTMLACNDDFCAFQSQTSAPVVSGNVYKIQIGGFSGSQGSYTMNITPAPTCPCSGAPPEGEPPPCGVPVDTFNGGCNSAPPVYSAIACGGSVCGNCAFNGSYRDTDWYQFTLTSPQVVTWTVTGENGMVAALLDNNCPPFIYSFVGAGACAPAVAQATLPAGTFVAFAAPDFSTIITCGTNDSYLGTMTCVPAVTPPNDSCATPIVVVGSGPFPWDNNGATTDGGSEFCGTPTNDIWYTWNATCTGNATFGLCVGGLTPDTVISVYNGAGCPVAGTAIACDDDACSTPAFGTSRCTFACTAGQDYTLRIGGFGGTQGSGMFDVQCQQSVPPGPCDIYDDGSSENAVGWGVTGTDILWMHVQGDTPLTTLVSSINTAWGTPAFPGSGPANGSTARVGIWQDTDNDGNPSTGLVLLQQQSCIVAGTDTDAFQVVPLSPPVTVTGHYFIGASADGTFPAPLDQAGPGLGRSWIVGDNTASQGIDYNNLNGEPFPPFNEDGIAPGVWLLEATCSGFGSISAYCFGSNTTCPCANGGLPGNGCANSDHPTGANLSWTGAASLAADTLQLTCTGHHNSAGVALFMQGLANVGPFVYGDGNRCIGSPFKRVFRISPANTPSLTAPSAASTPPSPATISGQSAALGDVLVPGSVRGYQLLYRDPVATFCPPGTFNASNAVSVVWAP